MKLLHVERRENIGVIGFIKRQLIGLFFLIVGIILALPYVPGPGSLFIVLAFLIIDFPKKRELILYLKHKKFFRLARILLRKKINVLLVLPRAKIL